ncbi:MAG: hypothetical protein ACR2PL_26510 [Dehalococcoidia bacterium]
MIVSNLNTIPLSQGTEYGVAIPAPTEILEYLQQHGDIVQPLLVTAEKFTQHFAGRAQLSLELHKSRESHDEYLVLYVRQQEYDKRIMQEIFHLRDELDGEITSVSGWLVATTDFRQPR